MAKGGKKNIGEHKKTTKSHRPMPGLVVNNIAIEKKNQAKKTEKKPETTPAAPAKYPLDYYKNSGRAYQWMWAGVITVALIIFLLWGWAISSNINSISWNKAQEMNLANQAKKDWDKIFAETKQKENIKQMVNDVLKQIAAAGITATSTTENSTTTSNATSTTTNKQ